MREDVQITTYNGNEYVSLKDLREWIESKKEMAYILKERATDRLISLDTDDDDLITLNQRRRSRHHTQERVYENILDELERFGIKSRE